jgi:hypothetical protein
MGVFLDMKVDVESVRYLGNGCQADNFVFRVEECIKEYMVV